MEKNKEKIEEYIQLVTAYLKTRAKKEEMVWELENQFIIDQFNSGVRNIFGIELNNLGFPLYDNQEFEKGGLNQFICWYLNAGYSIKN